PSDALRGRRGPYLPRSGAGVPLGDQKGSCDGLFRLGFPRGVSLPRCTLRSRFLKKVQDGRNQLTQFDGTPPPHATRTRGGDTPGGPAVHVRPFPRAGENKSPSFFTRGSSRLSARRNLHAGRKGRGE